MTDLCLCRSFASVRVPARPLKRAWLAPQRQARWSEAARLFHTDHRNRLSSLWVPSPPVIDADAPKNEGAHAKLMRAGFLRPAYPGVYQMLPMGCRVQDKIEVIINKHMRAIGASRLSLSAFSSTAQWAKSGRLKSSKGQLFQFKDRKDMQYLLSPTHEEEITRLVAKNIGSHRNLPIRLYQINRKYRDELRPRHGLLRSREFTMKDLYTFDLSVKAALETYNQVREAYAKIFAELKLPIMVAEASSGDMGGDLSHEYHLVSSAGEDDLISCGSCSYVANLEVARKGVNNLVNSAHEIKVWRGTSSDRQTLVNVWYAGVTADTSGKQKCFDDSDINVYAVKSIVPELDTSHVLEPAKLVELWDKILSQQTTDKKQKPRLINLIDRTLKGAKSKNADKLDDAAMWPTPGKRAEIASLLNIVHMSSDRKHLPLDLMAIREGDACPNCDEGTLKIQKAVELGHTFHLGTRYTAPFDVNVQVPGAADANSSTTTHPQMGCHGIGVSRMIGAAADHLADEKGLNWPRAIAPFEVVVMGVNGPNVVPTEIYDYLAESVVPGKKPLDILLDDRTAKTPGWKLRDADLVGYPVIVVVGRAWKEGERKCEVQCRRLGVKEDVALEDMPLFIHNLLDQV